jgi:hypothetical protein
LIDRRFLADNSRLKLVEIGHRLNLTNNVQRIVGSNAIQDLLLRNIAQSPRMRSFGWFDLEIARIDVAEARFALIIEEIEAVLGSDSELNERLLISSMFIHTSRCKVVDIFKNNETFPLFSSRFPPGYRHNCQVISGIASSRNPRLRLKWSFGYISYCPKSCYMQIPGVDNSNARLIL